MLQQKETTQETTNGASYSLVDSLWRVSVTQYHAMIEAGTFTENDPVELLQGWIVRKMPKKPKHTVVARLLFDLLTKLLPSGWFVNMQEPITTTDSEPEPDLSVVMGSPRDYFSHHSRPEDVALVVEVSDTTLMQDRNLKRRLYAAAAIPIYWLVNLPDNQIEVYSHPLAAPSGPDYGQRHTYGLNDLIPVTIADNTPGTIAVADLLPGS